MASLRKVFSLQLRTALKRDASILVTGTLIAQSVGVLAMLAISRLYDPKDLGVFAIFMAVLVLTGIFGCGKYEQAIFLAHSKNSAKYISSLSIAVLSINLIIYIALSSLLCIFLFLSGYDNFGKFLVFASISACSFSLNGYIVTIQNYCIQQQAFKDVAKYKISQSLLAASVSVFLGWQGHTSFGLLLGFVAGQMAAVICLIGKVPLANIYRQRLRHRVLAKKYIRFPKFLVLSDLLNNLGFNIITFFIPAAFGTATLGQFNLGQRVAGIPIAIVGSAATDIFRSRISPERADAEQVKKSFRRALCLLSFFGFIFIFPFLIFAPSIMTFTFGSTWRDAGIYLQILSPLFVVRFVASPLSAVLIIYERQSLDMKIQFLFLIASAAAIAVGILYGRFIPFLISFSVFQSVAYIYYTYVCYKELRGSISK